MQEWYEIDAIDQMDSPALVVYPKRILRNIEWAVQMAGDPDLLRPHVKTNKIAEVCRMMQDAGITRFKCATIAEAEMLAILGAQDVLLAYQPVGPKIRRLLNVIKAYPATRFSCTVDSEENVRLLSASCRMQKVILDVYIDLNVGMNRTGITAEKAPALIEVLLKMDNLRVVGLHAYDGHIHDEDIQVRRTAGDSAFDSAEKVYQEMTPVFSQPLTIVMGGSPTFPVHLNRSHCEYSPGTFVFWDWGYAHTVPDLPFEYAALLVTRIISILDKQHICLDLGHKSVAAEMPLPRVHFLNAPEVMAVSQSEEHLVALVPDSSVYTVGEVLYGVPVHICPTVALYEKAFVIEDHVCTGSWNVVARNRSIHF